MTSRDVLHRVYLSGFLWLCIVCQMDTAAFLNAIGKMNPNTLDDETLLNLGLTVLHEILTRRLHNGTGIAPKEKAVRATSAKKAVTQPALVISEDELSHDLLQAEIVDELTAESYESPAPTATTKVPDAPKKTKKAPAKSKQAAANAMFNVDEERRDVVEECD